MLGLEYHFLRRQPERRLSGAGWAQGVEGLGAFNVEKAIISCKGLDMEKGITDGNEMFSQAKQTMLKSAEACILAVDHTKFNRIAFSKICDVNDIHTVVTDEKPSAQWLELFERLRHPVPVSGRIKGKDMAIIIRRNAVHQVS